MLALSAEQPRVPYKLQIITMLVAGSPVMPARTLIHHQSIAVLAIVGIRPMVGPAGMSVHKGPKALRLQGRGNESL